MNSVNLKTGYLISAFPDFESALAATDNFCENGFKVVYLNEAAFVKDLEVEDYVLKYRISHKCHYHNYLLRKNCRRKLSAKSSLQTALKLLEINRQEAKFIVVISPKTTECGILPANLKTVGVSTY